MTIPLRETIARVPMWAKAQDIKVLPLTGGITNHNFRVDVGGKSFHLRMPGENTELLGIDREYEYKANLIAGDLAIAPEVVYFIRPEGYLVTRFIEGRPIPPEELRQPKNLQRVSELLHRIHSMPSIPGTFSAFQVVRDYAEIARRYNVELPEKFDWFISQMTDAEAALMRQHILERPCHNDLLNANFLATDKQIFVLDW